MNIAGREGRPEGWGSGSEGNRVGDGSVGGTVGQEREGNGEEGTGSMQ